MWFLTSTLVTFNSCELAIQILYSSKIFYITDLKSDNRFVRFFLYMWKLTMIQNKIKNWKIAYVCNTGNFFIFLLPVFRSLQIYSRRYIRNIWASEFLEVHFPFGAHGVNMISGHDHVLVRQVMMVSTQNISFYTCRGATKTRQLC